MATFASTKYPSLVVRFSNREKVRFNDGSVEVDEDQAERLVEFAKHHPDLGIEPVEAPEDDDPNDGDPDPDDEDDEDSDDEDDEDSDDEDDDFPF